MQPVKSETDALRSKTGFRLTSWDEHPVLVCFSTLGNDPLDDVWDGRACFALAWPYGISFR